METVMIGKYTIELPDIKTGMVSTCALFERALKSADANTLVYEPPRVSTPGKYANPVFDWLHENMCGKCVHRLYNLSGARCDNTLEYKEIEQ